MSEKEMNSYRFSSGEDPTDEMLSQIMKEVATDAINRRTEANLKYINEMERQRVLLKSRWEPRISNFRNGPF